MTSARPKNILNLVNPIKQRRTVSLYQHLTDWLLKCNKIQKDCFLIQMFVCYSPSKFSSKIVQSHTICSALKKQNISFVCCLGESPVDFFMLFYESEQTQILSRNENLPLLCISSFHLDTSGRCPWTEWATLSTHLDLSSLSAFPLMADILPNLKQWKLWAIKWSTKTFFTHAAGCIWSRRDEGKKVTAVGLFEHERRDLYQRINQTLGYELPLRAGKSSSMQWSYWLIREGLGWMARKEGEEVEEFGRCMNH